MKRRLGRSEGWYEEKVGMKRRLGLGMKRWLGSRECEDEENVGRKRRLG